MTASSLTSYPLTLRDITPWALRDVVMPIIQYSLEHGAILQGISGIGKTPLARAISTCMSAYHLAEDDMHDVPPSMRTSAHLDMFRSEPGLKHKPMVFDDGQTDQVRCHVPVLSRVCCVIYSTTQSIPLGWR